MSLLDKRYCLEAGTAHLFKGPEELVGKKCSVAELGEVCCIGYLGLGAESIIVGWTFWKGS